jgi:hypothetical protein
LHKSRAPLQARLADEERKALVTLSYTHAKDADLQEQISVDDARIIAAISGSASSGAATGSLAALARLEARLEARVGAPQSSKQADALARLEARVGADGPPVVATCSGPPAAAPARPGPNQREAHTVAIRNTPKHTDHFRVVPAAVSVHSTPLGTRAGEGLCGRAGLEYEGVGVGGLGASRAEEGEPEWLQRLEEKDAALQARIQATDAAVCRAYASG